jgi:DNA-binding transcriptional MerR regulator
MTYNENMSVSRVREEPAGGFGGSPEQGLYPISVVTELTGITGPTLRGYERAGLLTPARTDGGSRRYSDNDLTRLRRIMTLAAGGVNLAGIRHILDLEEELARLRAENDRHAERSSRRRRGTKPRDS